MEIGDRPLAAGSVGGDATVVRLLTQLRLLVQVLVIGAGTPEAAAMVSGLRQTAEQAAETLAVSEPSVLAAIGIALVHTGTGEYSQARTELLAASRRLRVLLRRELSSQAEPVRGQPSDPVTNLRDQATTGQRPMSVSVRSVVLPL